MKRCILKNPHARKTVAAVWRHLRAHFPDDARLLGRIITEIAPLSAHTDDGATGGQWFLFPFEEYEEAEEHGRGHGRMELSDDDQLTPNTVAHEMGHAFTSDEELIERGGPSDEWASEAAADMHAVRWGMLTLDDIRMRNERNEENALVDGVFHHGPVPGGGWVEIYGERWRLRDDFVFERTDKPKGGQSENRRLTDAGPGK